MIPSSLKFLPQSSFRLALCVLLALLALPAAAQSGRRSVPGSPSVTPPAPPVDPAEKTAERKEEKRQEIILTSDKGDSFAGIPLYFYTLVLESCAARLDDARSVRVDIVRGYTARSEAVSSAKAQKEAYVVWLSLRNDGLGRGVPTGDLSEIIIEYTVYEPTTAKVKANGSCFQGGTRAGGVVVGPRNTGGSNSAIAESRLRDAAEDVAERILKALHLVRPTDLPPH